MKKVLYLSLLLTASYASSMQLALYDAGNTQTDSNNHCNFESMQRDYNDTLSDIRIKDGVVIKPSSVFIPERLGSLQLHHNKDGFHVINDGQKHQIKKYFVDKTVRDINKEQLKAFLLNGYISVNQMNDGEYSLKANHRLNGGGPIFGTFAYWLTKSLCYGAILAGVGTATVVTGGAVGGIVGGATAGASVAVGTTIVATTSTAVIGTTAGAVTGTIAAGALVGTGATVASGVIGGVTGGAGAAALGVGAAGAAVGAGGMVAGIEAVSVSVGTFFGMLPLP
jgi:hypothetical protein